MDKLEIKQGSFIQQTQYFIPVEIDLSVVPARLGIWLFHLSRRTTVIQYLLVRRQFSLVPDNRTNVNVEAWYISLTIFLFRSGIAFYFHLYSTVHVTWRQKKYMCVYGHMTSKKSRVGQHYFFLLSAKPESRSRYPIFHFRNFR